MPALYGIPRPASQPGVYGLSPARPPLRPVRYVQYADGNATATLAATPAVGSILIVMCSSWLAGAQGISGGGVSSWTLVDTRASSTGGNVVQASLWWGVVGSTPSASVTCTFAGNGNLIVSEFRDMTGKTRASDKGTSNGGSSFTLKPLSGQSGGTIVYAWGYRGTPTGPGTFTIIATKTNGSTSRLAYITDAYIANDPIAITFANTDKQVAIAAVIA